MGLEMRRPVQPRRVNNLSALMNERGLFSAVYLFIFLDKKYNIFCRLTALYLSIYLLTHPSVPLRHLFTFF